MIKTFRHKGLRSLYISGSTRGVRVDHVARLRRLLASLEHATAPQHMDRPGNSLYLLKGDLADFWSVSVSGNWRLIYRFDGVDVELVDYLDYH